MTDYTVPSGTGQLLLRDTGTNVEFWIHAGSSATFINSPGKAWSWSSPHGSGGGTFTYPTGAPWIMLVSIPLTVNGTVTFAIGATGTTGLGGPTSISQALTRIVIPSQPLTPSVTDILPTSFKFSFAASASNGGATIDHYLMRLKKYISGVLVSTVDVTTVVLTNNLFIDKDPSSTYTLEVYAHNSAGYSPVSTIVSFTTKPASYLKVGGHYKWGIPFIKVAGVYKILLPKTKVSGVYKLPG